MRTDHGALQWFRNFKNPDFQLSSWIETMEEFGISIMSRSGLKHTNAADAMSRLPCCGGKKCVCSQCCDRSLVDVGTSTGVATILFLLFLWIQKFLLLRLVRHRKWILQ